jgi:RNA polymerase nonessential primary-like sigma factor
MPAPQKLIRSSCDALTQHLRAIGRIPLLTHEEEITLGRDVQKAQQLLEIEEELTLRAGGISPSEESWAAEAGLTPVELKRRLRRGGRAKNRMVAANLRLVVTIARKYASLHLELEDVIQEGNLGLIKAVEKFDPSRGYKFSTYAYWWIREGITRAISAKSRTVRLPVHVGETLSKLRRAQHTLWHELGRTPSIDELAAHTGLKELDIRESLFRAQQPLSLDTTPSDEGTSLLERIACSAEEPAELLSRSHMLHDIQDLLKHLPEDQAELLRLRYGINTESPMPLSAVARNMGVTRDTARGIERRAINNVKELSEHVIDYLRA